MPCSHWGKIDREEWLTNEHLTEPTKVARTARTREQASGCPNIRSLGDQPRTAQHGTARHSTSFTLMQCKTRHGMADATNEPDEANEANETYPELLAGLLAG